LITKLNFVSVTGPKSDLDRMVSKYLSKFEIHLEYAPSELKSSNTLHPFTEANPYKEVLSRGEELLALTGRELTDKQTEEKNDFEKCISDLYDKYVAQKKLEEEYDKKLLSLNELLNKVMPFVDIEYDIDDILKFKYLKYRFGRIPKEHYKKFDEYVYDSVESVFVKSMEDDKYVWGVYFVPQIEKDSVDAAYASLHFERTYMPNEVTGTPKEECDKVRAEIEQTQNELSELKKKFKIELEANIEDLKAAVATAREHSFAHEIRKYAACTKESGISYYILCGWMSKEDSKAFEKLIADNEPDTICIVDEQHKGVDSEPPTKLKNPKLFKPFEMYIRMYGIPSYNEIDPTIFVALTYSFIFGAMFGDVGHGLLLLIGGLLLYKIKKINLAAIIASAGFFSTIFGFMFGSIFGFEDIIKPIWLRPMSAMTNLPFIGTLNTVFIVAIAFGMGLILVAMILNMINAIKAGEKGRLIFDTNGLMGFIFYGAVVLCIVLFMTGNKLPGAIVLLVMFGIPLILIAFKEPIINKLNKKKELIEGGKGMFVVQTFFELFELLLSYFSNTLSFVRVGAFAVSHAAMMEVVMMLAGAENGGSGNIIVIIIGNLFVCGLEGLIVGIQVLRLEYYEMFSRFYKGDGREFKAYGREKK
jgi:V/A-type H+-transporting ATPase subunit I